MNKLSSTALTRRAKWVTEAAGDGRWLHLDLKSGRRIASISGEKIPEGFKIHGSSSEVPGIGRKLYGKLLKTEPVVHSDSVISPSAEGMYRRIQRRGLAQVERAPTQPWSYKTDPLKRFGFEPSIATPTGEPVFKMKSNVFGKKASVDVIAFLDELEKIGGVPNGMLQASGKNLSRDEQTFLYNRLNAHAFGQKSSQLPQLSGRLEARAWGKNNRKTAREALTKISLDMGWAGSVGQRTLDWGKRHAMGAAKNVGEAAAAWTKPRESLSKGWKETWRPGGQPLHPAWKALMGYSLLTGAQQALPKKDPTGMGHSRIRRTARLVGDQVGGIMGAPFGFWGGTASSMIGSKIGDTAGAAVDRLRGHRPQPHLPPKPVGQQV